MLTVERPALEHTLDQLRHVEPAAAHGRVEGHNAMRAQPQHQVGRLVAGEVVPHQQQPQRRQVVRQREGPRQTRLPHRPGRWRSGRILRWSRWGQLGQDRALGAGDLQARNLADPQTRRIGRRQRDTVAQARNRFQKADDLLGIETGGSFSGSAQRRGALLTVVAQHAFVEFCPNLQ